MKKLLFLFSIFALFSCSNDGTDDTKDSELKDKELFDGKVLTKKINVSGELHHHQPNSILLWHSSMHPNISYYANTDNSVDIAWHDKSSNKIKITSIDKDGNKTKEITPEIPTTQRLLGMTKIPNSSDYFVGYSVNTSEHNLKPERKDNDLEYWITRVTSEGKKVFNTPIFGLDNYYKSRAFNPGASGTARLVYNANDNMIGFHIACNRYFGSYSRGLRVHQGGYFGIIDTDGNFPTKRIGSNGHDYTIGNPWFISHSFDQRIIADKEHYVMLSLGDIQTSRGIVLSKWNVTRENEKPTNTHRTLWKRILAVDGGGNQTYTQIGDIRILSDGNYGITYSTKVTDGHRNIFYKKVDSKSGETLVEKQLTSIKEEKKHAVYPKIANFNSNYLVSWHVTGNDPNDTYSNFVQIDAEGNTMTEVKKMEDINLQLEFDQINLPNGNIFWAVKGNANNELILNWIKVKE